VRNSKVTIPVPRSDNARLLARSLLAEISTSHLLGWRTKINTKSRGLLEVLSSPGQQTPTEDIGERGTEDSAFLDAGEQPPPYFAQGESRIKTRTMGKIEWVCLVHLSDGLVSCSFMHIISTHPCKTLGQCLSVLVHTILLTPLNQSHSKSRILNAVPTILELIKPAHSCL
jgi:hypothetical protein